MRSERGDHEKIGIQLSEIQLQIKFQPITDSLPCIWILHTKSVEPIERLKYDYCKDDAKSLKEIANKMGLDITAYVDWIRVERRLSSSLRSLTRWGWVALERRQREEGHKFWYNAYWKTELAKQ